MNGLSAVIFIPEDMTKHGYTHPMMLQPVLGVPLLRWLSYSLYENGVELSQIILSKESVNLSNISHLLYLIFC